MPWQPGPRARWILQCVAALSILCDNAVLVQPSARPSVPHPDWVAALATAWRTSPTPLLPSGHLRKLRGGSSSSQSMNDEACVLMALGGEDNLHRAEAALRAALDENPANAAALCNYGRLLQRQDRDLELAGDMLAKAVRLRPEAAIFSSYALFLEDGVRDLVRARELYERALLLHPADPVLLHNFAELLRCHVGVGAAAPRGGEGQDNPSSRPQERPGHARRTAQQEWDLGLARSLYKRALLLQPLAAPLLNGLGTLLQDMGDTSAARLVLEQASRAHPNDAATCCSLAMLEYSQPGRHGAAQELYRRALDISPGHDVALCNLSDLLRRSPGTRSEAYELLERALRESPDNTHALMSLGMMLVEDGRREEALAVLQQAQEQSPDDEVVGQESARVAQGRGCSGVLPVLRETFVMRHDDAAFRASNCSASPASNGSSVSSSPCTGSMKELLGGEAGGDEGGALSAGDAALLLLARSQGEASGSGAGRWANEGQTRQLHKLLVAAARSEPSDASRVTAMARALIAPPFADADAALDVVEAALELQPQHPGLLCVEAVALASGQYEEAREALAGAVRLRPADASLRAAHGLSLKADGHYAAAEDAYKAALRLAPRDPATPVVMVNYGLLLEAWQGDWDMANTWYRRALAVDPSNQQALLQRGRIFEDEVLDREAAADFYEQAGLRGCDASLAAQGFARAGLLHWHALNHTGKAYGLLMQAAATDPTNALALRTLAALQTQLGEGEEAVGLYARAAALAPSDAAIVAELADVYQDIGRVQESEESYLRALALCPSDVDALRGYAHLLRQHRGQDGMAAQLYATAKALDEAETRHRKAEEARMEAFLADDAGGNASTPVVLEALDEHGRPLGRSSRSAVLDDVEGLLQRLADA